MIISCLLRVPKVVVRFVFMGKPAGCTFSVKVIALMTVVKAEYGRSSSAINL